jgi:hypothetical protein
MRTNRSGHLIVPTLLMLSVIALLVSGALIFSQHFGRIARETSELSSALAMADGECERLYSGWRNLAAGMPMGQLPTQSQLDAVALPVPVATSVHPGFAGGQFLSSYAGRTTHDIIAVDAFGTPVVSGSNGSSIAPLPGYRGLYALNTFYRVRVAASRSALGHDPTTEVERQFTKAEAPIFQSAIFFEDDLELHPGETMTINGPVITNHNLYAAGLIGKGLTLSSYASYNKDYSYYQTPPSATGYDNSMWQAPTYPSGQAMQLSKADRLEPSGKDMRDTFDTTDVNPNNDGYRELIEKPDTAYTDPPQIAPYRFYNQASLKVSVSQVTSGTTTTQTVTVKRQDGSAASAPVASAVAAAIGTRHAVYDRREQKDVSVTPVDVAALSSAIDLMNASGNAADHFNGIAYLSDDSPDSNQRAFRLENGGRLPTYARPANSSPTDRGFSVATDAGIYIQGDYNSYSGAAPVPSAVLADAVMILSNSWDDTRSSNPLYGVDDPSDPSTTLPGTARKATETTVQTAIMAGTIPTGYDPTPADPSNGDNYGASGGAHNFPRFLEDWKGVSFNFKGSMVQLFTSKYFTGQWATGDVYYPPTRNWSYNEDFLRHPSPGLFAFTTYSRGSWKRN